MNRYNYFKLLNIFIFILAISLLFSSSVLSHGGEEDEHDEEKNGFDWTNPVFYIKITSVFLVVVSVFLLLAKNLKEPQKKLIFWLISILVVSSTLYLAGHTVYKNVNSVTKGPVHWHADYQIWLCGERFDLVDPKGMNNRIGDAVLHEHNDDRMHIEGVVSDLEDVNLGNYFKIIGGELTNYSMTYNSNKGIMSYKDGDKCNEEEGKLKVYVNGKKIVKPESYVPAPHINVPPGDCIIIDFSQGDSETTDKICESWAVKLGGYDLSVSSVGEEDG